MRWAYGKKKKNTIHKSDNHWKKFKHRSKNPFLLSNNHKDFFIENPHLFRTTLEQVYIFILLSLLPVYLSLCLSAFLSSTPCLSCFQFLFKQYFWFWLTKTYIKFSKVLYLYLLRICLRQYRIGEGDKSSSVQGLRNRPRESFFIKICAILRYPKSTSFPSQFLPLAFW